MTLVGDWHVLFPAWQGYGSFIPFARDLMRDWKGRVDLVVMRTARSGEDIVFDVYIQDPEHGGYEQDEDLRCVWTCCVGTKRGEVHPTYNTVAAARDQQYIADTCVDLLCPKDGQ